MNKIFVGVALIVSMLILGFTTGANRIITGRVIDNSGNALAAASIVVKGTANGASSDASGLFSIEVPESKKVLLVSLVGYESKEFKLGKDTSITITLFPTKQSLQEVVVVGYGATSNGYLVGQPGASTRIMIRGNATLSGSVAGINITNGNFYSNKREYKSDKNLSDTVDYEREGYDRIVENSFLKATDNPMSTFSIDVDAASYSNVRRMLNYGKFPPAGAVRIEEMINYFTYAYPQPTGSDPFTINTEIANCPWNEEHRLVSIGLQGKRIPTENLPATNLTFLIDVSGSMNEETKLPLVKSSLKLLIEQLREQDKVSIVVYAGNAGLVLKPTPGSNKQAIKDALEKLEAGGSTAGGQGIQLAYNTAKENFIKGGNNRVILCTDGDFNVGISSDDALERLIEDERKSGIFLTVLGYGMGNYQDAKMQKLADKGNGNHAYIDNLTEAKKVLVNEFGGTLFTIAKDVKLQVEFNPAKVQGYRLLGYENRMLAKEDFNNDKKDAGELGSGHTVTAMYEIIPVGVKSKEFEKVDALRYQKPQKQNENTAFNSELMNIKLRYKQPDGDVSKLIQHAVMDQKTNIATTSDNLRFAAAVAQFGLLLRNSAYKYNSNYKAVEQLATNAMQNDKEGYRKEFLELVKKAQKLSKDVAMVDDDE